MTEWIKCSDRLPEKYGRYLVFSQFNGPVKAIAWRWAHPSNKVNIAYLILGDVWQYASDNFCEPHIITHWAELLEPPEDV